ncbi:hypothetical protein DYB37_003772 [Aphanomyces astaci]|uniref:Uncharacterized protein n=1 Tax=Aphanomyces astaci TaxID=112090 RepID=A0A397BEJ8_APHAT|nr:hypothetical protein AaE_006346 [Aphanomyces astaci]RHY19079.1 hypothetical protein DYB36_004815 [Aphanomyces astaci]RHY97124.1 hypothetical protein DYB35_003051 [Aphanomyces astaci]RHZ33056.1 hypothetical protein DYB37_003772 [Aphanomyces astaci]RLO01870.1 hypothetical protein DYB28_000176 [Aphanomyces astaci]
MTSMSATPPPTEPDEFEANLNQLIVAYGCGLVFFLVGFACCYHWTQHIHASQTVCHVPELTMIKINTKLLRGLCVAMLSAQLALFAHSISLPDSGKAASLFDSLNRPLGAMLGIAFGFSTNFHTSFRVFVAAFLAALVILDSISAVHYVSIRMCAKKGALCSSSKALTADRLALLIARDMVGIALQVWALLVTSFLCVSIGICHSRYSPRQLSISNPYSNIRDLLTKYHPHLNVKHSV